MNATEFILFPGSAAWSVACVRPDGIEWLEVNVADADPTALAGAVAAALAGHATTAARRRWRCRRKTVWPSACPRSVCRGATGGRWSTASKNNCRWAAEDVVADFAQPSVAGDVLAACVVIHRTAPLVAALEAAGVTVGAIVPAQIAAAQRLAAPLGGEDVVLLLDEPASGGNRLSAVTLQGGRCVDWAYLPTDVDDVKLHLELVAADLQISPRLRAFGLAESFTASLAGGLGCVVPPAGRFRSRCGGGVRCGRAGRTGTLFVRFCAAIPWRPWTPRVSTAGR